MIISGLLLFYFLILQFFAHNAKKYIGDGLPYLFLFVSLILLNLVRLYGQSSFPDIPEYKYMFEQIQPISFIIKNGYGLDDYAFTVEIGYRYFISIFKLFSSNFSSFLFFTSLIQLSVFYYFCKRYKISTVNAFPIYIALTYLTFQIGMLRQALAFCIFLIALIHINKKTIYLLLIFLGITFHNSMIFCLSLIWVDKFINRKLIYFLFLFSLILYVLKVDLINSIISFSGFDTEFDALRIGYYMNSVDRQNNYLGIGFWERVILFISMNFIYKELLINNKINKYNNLIYNLGVSVILLQIFFFASPTITSRLRYYTIIFPLIFISEYIYTISKNKLKWSYQFFFSIYLFIHLSFQVTYLTE
ncbi:hypothetical protein KCTC32516_01459 [Polaribacter huanghezhanensis]|uniref:EpsG family protein n=1 Tax=Polaribacter huanghezhanensis TaxID=1354726 RepID=UPI00345141E3|nr:hypothetical protein KCTC32516_01459 [Polaribacter huanghezhanensis]